MDEMEDEEPSQEFSQPDHGSSATMDVASKPSRRTSVKAAMTRVSKAQDKHKADETALNQIIQHGENLLSLDNAFAKKFNRDQTSGLLQLQVWFTKSRSSQHQFATPAVESSPITQKA